MMEFKEAVVPIKAWLDKYGCPHTSVIIEHDFAKVVNDELGVPLKVLD